MRRGVSILGSILSVVLCGVLAACGTTSGGGSTTPPTSSTTYTIGGTVSGLSGTGLILQNNGGNNLTVSATGGFTFTTAIARGGTYNVTVLSQPSSPAQNCVATNGSGTVTSANVTSVQVTCTAATFTIGGTVSGLSGTGLALQLVSLSQPPAPIDEILGVSANGPFTFPIGLPSGTEYSVTVDAQPSNPVQTCVLTNGNAGTATANVTNVAVICGATTGPNEWAWVSGANTSTRGDVRDSGTAAAGNIPGARAVRCYLDRAAGNFWLFGGEGYDSAGTAGYLNDLWKYSAGQWTWMGGSNVADQSGTYGTQGTAAAGNIPGARDGLLLGPMRPEISGSSVGLVTTQRGHTEYLNDLWKYSAGRMDVDERVERGQPERDVRDSGHGCRGQRSWGARQFDYLDRRGRKFLALRWSMVTTRRGHSEISTTCGSTAAGQWTWMSGSNVANQSGTYGTQGTAAAVNVPGARAGLYSWTERPEISGSSAGMVTTQRGQPDTSTTYGNTVRANGRGWVGRTWPTRAGRTGLRARLPWATFLGRGTGLILGPTRLEIFGSSVGPVIPRWGTRGKLEYPGH